MSDSTPYPQELTELERRRPSASHKTSNASSDVLSSGGSLSQVDAPTPWPVLPRHWHSLQDHADTISEAELTPNPENRREGFTWETAIESDISDDQTLRETSTSGPSGIGYDQREEDAALRRASKSSTDTVRHDPAAKRVSIRSSFSDSISRWNTSRSSINSIARGFTRGMPNLRMFGTDEKKNDKGEDAGSSTTHDAGLRKLSQSMTSKLVPALKMGASDDKGPKRVQLLDKPVPGPTYSVSPKGELKDRRNLNDAHAMKLTLPLGLPDLPPRQRNPISPISHPKAISSPRPRSPETPFLADHPVHWHSLVEVSQPPTILETPGMMPSQEGNKHGHGLLPGSDTIHSSESKPRDRTHQPRAVNGRPRFYRRRSHKSDGSPRTPDRKTPDEHPARISEDLKQMGKRSRRWLRSGRYSSNDLDSPDSPPPQLASQYSTRKPSLPTRFLNPLKWKSQTPRAASPATSASPPTNNPTSWLRKFSFSSTTSDPARMQNRPLRSRFSINGPSYLTQSPRPHTDPLFPPATPPFQPSGVQRVNTPPPFNQESDVRRKLANFFFDYQYTGAKRSKRSPATTGGIWDSDALLMSQETSITPRSSPGDESPQSHEKDPLSPPTPLPQSQRVPFFGSDVNAPPLPTAESRDWFRVRVKEDEIMPGSEVDEQQRQRFEWLVPEHLPGSPLCPLSDKYRGKEKEFCVFHGRKKDSVVEGAARIKQPGVVKAAVGGRKVNGVDGVREGKGNRVRVHKNWEDRGSGAFAGWSFGWCDWSPPRKKR
ncbi:hypothetical protein K469DRAFT_684629 [Zopfia rhizophila CBS 207.26]|uniref:Uncharacterized protein n=1 Tax=Zopfia rhizophila CBS 207.26 TaxID=1314779 RepID=A0A6A6ECT5_9PEZI|nr:hypothetical protein K469DRAFT_684629 [Zopfia rhizophila CBS 207.26]